ncbi:MAG: hypothetical protein U1F49_14515 [Rubrivivax sp.]
MAAEAGAELTMMEGRFVPARFKDGYGSPSARGSCPLRPRPSTLRRRLHGQEQALLDQYPPYGQAAVPASCLRNHLMLKEMKEGRGPIYMDTVTALAKLRESLNPRARSTSRPRRGKTSSACASANAASGSARTSSPRRR